MMETKHLAVVTLNFPSDYTQELIKRLVNKFFEDFPEEGIEVNRIDIFEVPIDFTGEEE